MIPVSQNIFRAYLDFAEANPAWIHMANVAVNRWGRAEATLQQCIAEALMQAHAMGQSGELPALPVPETSKVIRRTVKSIAKTRVIRRTR